MTETEQDKDREPPTRNEDKLATYLAEETPLTDRQAEALAYEYFGIPRPKAAEKMGVAVRTRDKHLQKAKERLEQSKTLAEVDEKLTMEYREPASECSECGATLGGSYARGEEGALCWDCAPVDVEEALP